MTFTECQKMERAKNMKHTENEEALNEEETASLISAVRDAVINEYLNTNEMTPEEFAWPEPNSTAWHYCGELAARYMGHKFVNVNHDVNPRFIPGSPDKEIIDAVFHGFITWFETYGRDSYDRYAAAIAVLQPYNHSIPAIDLTKSPITGQ